MTGREPNLFHPILVEAEKYGPGTTHCNVALLEPSIAMEKISLIMVSVLPHGLDAAFCNATSEIIEFRSR
jgi:hypothetical protein